MGKFREWLRLHEMEPADDADADTESGYITRFARKPWVKNIVGTQPAVAGSAVAAAGTGVTSNLRSAIYGQGENQYGAQQIHDPGKTERQGFSVFKVKVNPEEVADWRLAKLTVARQILAMLKTQDNYARFDVAWAMVSKAPVSGHSDSSKAQVVFEVELAPPRQGQFLYRNLSSARYELLFTQDVVMRLADRQLMGWLQGNPGGSPNPTDDAGVSTGPVAPMAPKTPAPGTT